MIKQKILLMFPSTITTDSFGFKFSSMIPLYQIAGLLNYYNYNITVKDFSRENYGFKNNIKYIIDNMFDIIFIFSTIDFIKSTHIYIKAIKKLSLKSSIIVSHKMNKEIDDEIFNTNCADIIIHGEEDYTVLDIVSGKDLKDIKGISYRDENGNIIHNEPRPLINLDDLPEAIYGFELFPMETKHYFDIYLSTNRGCNHRCIYCRRKDYNSDVIRYRSPELVALEIKHLTDKYKINSFRFSDNTFTSNKNHVLEIMDAFDKYKINIKWHCFSRVDTIDEELLQSMYNHGCYGIVYGGESIDKNILNFINKNITPEQVEYAVKLSKKIGIRTKLHYMIGNPGETMKSAISSAIFCRSLKPNAVEFNISTPVPGTPLYDYCVENDLLLTKDWNKYTFNHQIIKLEKILDYKIEVIRKKVYQLVNDNGFTNNINYKFA